MDDDDGFLFVRLRTCYEQTRHLRQCLLRENVTPTCVYLSLAFNYVYGYVNWAENLLRNDNSKAFFFKLQAKTKMKRPAHLKFLKDVRIVFHYGTMLPPYETLFRVSG